MSGGKPFNPAYVKKILVIRIDAIGDLILTTPLFRAIKSCWPGKVIHVLASPYNRAVAERCPFVDRVHALDLKAGFLEKIERCRSLRQEYYDLTFVSSPTTWSYIACAMAGSPHRTGIVYGERPVAALAGGVFRLLTHPVTVSPRVRLQKGERVPHEVENGLAMLTRLGASPGPGELCLEPSEDDRKGSAALLQDWGWDEKAGILCVHLSQKWLAHGWDIPFFQRLVNDLQKQHPGFNVLFTCGPAEREMGKKLESLYGSRGSVAVASGLGFGEWAALAGMCRLMISTDTSAVHVAASRKVPVVALYAPEDFGLNSAQFAPWGVPCVKLKQGDPIRLEREIVEGAECLVVGG